MPIVIGVAMAWYSEMEISRSAVWVSVVCILLNATKVVINSEMLTGEYKVRLLNSSTEACVCFLSKVNTAQYVEPSPLLMPSLFLIFPVKYFEK